MVDTFTKHNSSVSGSREESDAEPHLPLPLPPIKHEKGRHPMAAPARVKKHGHQAAEKSPKLKAENSQQTLAKQGLSTKKLFHEDIKADKAILFKKTFLEGAKIRKKFLNA